MAYSQLKHPSHSLVLLLSLLIGNVVTVDVVRMSVQSEYEEIFVNEQLQQYESKDTVGFSIAKHFQNNMVLQRAPARANIYGFSPDIGQKVIMQMSAPDKPHYYETNVVQGPAPGVGVWNFLLDPMEANVTVGIVIESEAGGASLRNVIFGDVWLCSGQSNMQFTVIQMLGAKEEIDDASNYPNIRLMTVADDQSATPLYDLNQVQQAWTAPDESSVGGPAWQYFSAVCWLYGKAIHKALGVPIGMVATDWGGTPVEAWSSPQALAKCGVTDDEVRTMPTSYLSYLDKLSPEERFKLGGPQNNTVLWNAMINPLLGMTIYGAIWYQGENDAHGTMMNRYNCTFPSMINDWRLNFNKASNGQTNAMFPFGFVQLAPNKPDPKVTVGFPDIRWHQTADWGYVPNRDMPNVFMAVALDLPDFHSSYGSIHPQDKKDVGYRLGLSGLAVAYGKPETFQGPFPQKGVLTDDSLVVLYENSPLEVRDTEGFELLCGSDASTGEWIPTSIVANNATTVTLFSKVCSQEQTIQGLRYAWRESPCDFMKCAVYGTKNNLPGPPFIGYTSGDKKNVGFEMTGRTLI